MLWGFFPSKHFFFFSFSVNISHLQCPSVSAMKIWCTVKKNWLRPTNSWELLHKVCIEIWPWGCEERLQGQHTQVSSPPHLIVTRGLQESFFLRFRQNDKDRGSTSQYLPGIQNTKLLRMLPNLAAVKCSHFLPLALTPYTKHSIASHRGNLW